MVASEANMQIVMSFQGDHAPDGPGIDTPSGGRVDTSWKNDLGPPSAVTVARPAMIIPDSKEKSLRDVGPSHGSHAAPMRT